MKQEYILREYDSGGKEVICTEYAPHPLHGAVQLDANRKVVYNTGDVVYFLNDKVVAIVPYDCNLLRWPMVDWVKQPDGSYKPEACKVADTHVLDGVEFPKKTQEASDHERKESVLRNLNRNPHYYDSYIRNFHQCRTCNGVGKIPGVFDVGVQDPMQTCPTCKDEKSVITEDTIKRFFDINPPPPVKNNLPKPKK